LEVLWSSLGAGGRPTSMHLPRQAGLQNFTELAQWLAGAGTGPAGEDRKIAGPAGPGLVRGYRPDPSTSSATGPGFPAAVFFHGGGWGLGGLESPDTRRREPGRAAGGR